jgi:hypothetical protein
MPRQVVIEYLWGEDVLLDGPEFGAWNGQTTTMLCGGTLVVDDNGNVLEWAQKPGSLPYGKRTTKEKKRWLNAIELGKERANELRLVIADRVAHGQVGPASAAAFGLLPERTPPVTAVENDGAVRFRLSPRFHICGEAPEEEQSGARQWELSC